MRGLCTRDAPSDADGRWHIVSISHTHLLEQTCSVISKVCGISVVCAWLQGCLVAREHYGLRSNTEAEPLKTWLAGTLLQS